MTYDDIVVNYSCIQGIIDPTAMTLRPNDSATQ